MSLPLKFNSLFSLSTLAKKQMQGKFCHSGNKYRKLFLFFEVNTIFGEIKNP
ncbi:hypothetical protein CEV32_3599 [Brucella rhizosphaerae]|uniref:Uncharacterized protein n=1 Tax=Brucella rhizosphaerae TaxID=571254 RepID=A0A256FSR9_9HYPH|nr:hypothetical protein CEV32_3599 [Brucella rhizosphaerae]